MAGSRKKAPTQISNIVLIASQKNIQTLHKLNLEYVCAKPVVFQDFIQSPTPCGKFCSKSTLRLAIGSREHRGRDVVPAINCPAKRVTGRFCDRSGSISQEIYSLSLLNLPMFLPAAFESLKGSPSVTIRKSRCRSGLHRASYQPSVYIYQSGRYSFKLVGLAEAQKVKFARPPAIITYNRSQPSVIQCQQITASENMDNLFPSTFNVAHIGQDGVANALSNDRLLVHKAKTNDIPAHPCTAIWKFPTKG
ncbi:hypothetical protein BD779DRAFT_1465138 [Infundibulicybe gibba]|nr:hypothetical protein BD779DRAFT_1465138 [Infundibulicybe gibba]